MIIRKTEKPELPRIAEIESLCFSHPWSLQSLTSSFESAANVFYTAEEDGEIIGYLSLCVAADEGYILNVAVDPSFRRHGAGRALVENALKSHGNLSFVTLEVRPSNTAAVALYTSLGFEKVGERKNYYSNPVENAVLLTKYLK